MGQPRRVVTYASNLQPLNIWVSVSAFVLGLSMLVFLANLIYSLGFARVRAARNPWGSLSIEWQLPSPVPVQNFDQTPVFENDPYGYGDGDGARRVARPAACRPGGGDDERDRVGQGRSALRGRRAGAPADPRAQPALRRPPLRERDGDAVPRVLLRLLLSVGR